MDNTKKHLCILCNFSTNRKAEYVRHLNTKKHILTYSTNDNKMINKNTQKTQNDIWNCNCGKSYKYQSGLSRHKLNCNYTLDISNNNDTDNNDYKDMFLKMFNENQEFKKIILDQQQKLIEIIPKIGNNVNNITNNQKFNINVFLNEKCRDAIDITDFIKSIKISIEQLDTIKTTGMADGLSSAIITNLKNLSVYERPIHCTDIKRETLYIKDDNHWECDRDQKKIKTAIKQMAVKPYVPLQEWIARNPDFKDVDEKQDYVANVLSTIGKPLDNIDKKIIKNVCASTLIK
tara:strand:+ start:7402 stop:8271 length:870 start_codon:yes stop_codon:yes gene_type:complete